MIGEWSLQRGEIRGWGGDRFSSDEGSEWTGAADRLGEDRLIYPSRAVVLMTEDNAIQMLSTLLDARAVEV